MLPHKSNYTPKSNMSPKKGGPFQKERHLQSIIFQRICSFGGVSAFSDAMIFSHIHIIHNYIDPTFLTSISSMSISEKSSFNQKFQILEGHCFSVTQMFRAQVSRHPIFPLQTSKNHGKRRECSTDFYVMW